MTRRSTARSSLPEVAATAEVRDVTIVFEPDRALGDRETDRRAQHRRTLGRLARRRPTGIRPASPSTRVDATHWRTTVHALGTRSSSTSTRSAAGTTSRRDDVCGEIANRLLTVSYGATGTQTVSDTTANWRNVAPCGNVRSHGGRGRALARPRPLSTGSGRLGAGRGGDERERRLHRLRLVGVDRVPRVRVTVELDERRSSASASSCAPSTGISGSSSPARTSAGTRIAAASGEGGTPEPRRVPVNRDVRLPTRRAAARPPPRRASSVRKSRMNETTKFAYVATPGCASTGRRAPSRSAPTGARRPRSSGPRRTARPGARG